MDINLFFNKMVKELNLGNIIEEPLKVTGGLTHRMFKIVTDKGRYIVKLLNPNIMKRPTAMNNFDIADKFEEILKENNIDAIYSLKFNDKKMQEIDGQYFYVYEWFDGKSLKDDEITIEHCKKIGKLLAHIHNIDLRKDDTKGKTRNIDFNKFNAFFESYIENTTLDMNVDWKSIYYANNGRIEWLEFNIKRVLMIECDTIEEQQIGINEVKETIEHVAYYDKVKDEIIGNIYKLIKR